SCKASARRSMKRFPTTSRASRSPPRSPTISYPGPPNCRRSRSCTCIRPPRIPNMASREWAKAAPSRRRRRSPMRCAMRSRRWAPKSTSPRCRRDGCWRRSVRRKRRRKRRWVAVTIYARLRQVTGCRRETRASAGTERQERKIDVTIGRHDVSGYVLAALAVGLVAAAPVRAAGEPAFFNGKQVRFYTMGSPGGGYDTYMRALIPHLEKKLGAKMLPTNEPGAGGLIAINHTLHAPPDGLTILLVGGETLVTAQLYDAPGVNYDVRKLTWLARVSS